MTKQPTRPAKRPAVIALGRDGASAPVAVGANGLVPTQFVRLTPKNAKLVENSSVYLLTCFATCVIL